MLNTAARHGIPELSLSAIGMLGRQGVLLQEHHIAPHFEALVRVGNMTEAIRWLATMRSGCVNPSSGTVAPLILALTRSPYIAGRTPAGNGLRMNAWMIESSPSQRIAALSTFLSNIHHGDGVSIDVTIFNALLEAYAKTRSTEGANALWGKRDELGVDVDVESYNAMLRVCLAADDHLLGQHFVSTLRMNGIRPNVATYELAIKLAFRSSSTSASDPCQLGLDLIAEMKAYDMTPSIEIFEQVASNLAQLGQSSRLRELLREMHLVGYTMSRTLRHALPREERYLAQKGTATAGLDDAIL